MGILSRTGGYRKSLYFLVTYVTFQHGQLLTKFDLQPAIDNKILKTSAEKMGQTHTGFSRGSGGHATLEKCFLNF